MKDTIDKNLEFKVTVFITLLGAWFLLIKRYIGLIPLSLNWEKFFAFILIFSSYILFYPLIYLGIMLVYISIYQVEDSFEKINIIKIKYNKSAVEFFRWWPMVLIISPILLIISIFGSKYIAIVFVVSTVYILILWKTMFNKLYTFGEVLKLLQNSYRLFLLYLIFFVIILMIIQSNYNIF